MKKRYYLLAGLIAALLLVAGGLLYLFYRPMSLRLFKWLSLDEESSFLVNIRQNVPDFYSWIIYALPDGLWSCAYVLVIGMIWGFDYKKCFPVTAVIPVIGILSEFGQAVGLVPGIFDIADFFSYLLGWIAGYAMIYIFASHNNRIIKYEKN